MSYNGSATTTKNYSDGIEYSGTALEAIYHSEGRVTKPSTTFQYEYALKDHLGNSRAMFKMNGSTPELLQENHYYPFGLEMEGTWQPQLGVENLYQYNGKELNEDLGLNWNDYGARWYDASLGRWGSIDPLADKHHSKSSYNYVSNNPIAYIDPDGMDPIAAWIRSNPSIKVETVYFENSPDQKGGGDFYVNPNGQYLGRDNNSNSNAVRVIDSQAWYISNKEDPGEAEPLRKSSTLLSGYLEGIDISDETWDLIEENGGDRMTPTVANESNSDVAVLPGRSEDPLARLMSGQDYYAPVDGIKTEKHNENQVYKIGNGGKVSVGLGGSITTTKYSLGHSFFNPGTKGKGYLDDEYKKSKAHGDNWKRLYDAKIK